MAKASAGSGVVPGEASGLEDVEKVQNLLHRQFKDWEREETNGGHAVDGNGGLRSRRGRRGSPCPAY